MANRTITAMFDSVDEAERASRELAMKIAGVRGSLYSAKENPGGMTDLGLPAEDYSMLEEGVRRGGVVLTAEVPEQQFATAADVLEGCGAVDLDAREQEWRGQGWTGSSASTATGGTAAQGGGMATGSSAVSGATVASGATTGGSRATGASATARTETAQTGREESIPIVEERLRVGKRETAHGRVRIRSYVVETPVQEQVTLHQEHVQVERRPTDRPVTDADRLFQDRTIEATERSEEAVVAKEARVKEEVVIRKTAEDKTRTISDTVRRTEVEVDDDRRAGSASTGTTTPRNPSRGA